MVWKFSNSGYIWWTEFPRVVLFVAPLLLVYMFFWIWKPIKENPKFGPYFLQWEVYLIGILFCFKINFNWPCTWEDDLIFFPSSLFFSLSLKCLDILLGIMTYHLNIIHNIENCCKCCKENFYSWRGKLTERN